MADYEDKKIEVKNLLYLIMKLANPINYQLLRVKRVQMF